MIPPLPPYLKELEAEAIHIIRETVSNMDRVAMLYSVGKDSSVLVRLAQKAFYPNPVSFPLLHIDTGYKFPEMYAFRDQFCKENDLNLIVERNESWIEKSAHPDHLGMDKCCGYLKTTALLDALKKHDVQVAIAGARRDEEKSRAKERVFSFRNQFGVWDPKNQRPELWHLYNTHLNQGESLRVFPLSNWTEMDIWQYIKAESIPIVPIYFAHPRLVQKIDGKLIPLTYKNGEVLTQDGGDAHTVMCRFRSLGCTPCSGAVESSATTVDDIIEELMNTKQSERVTRLIDHQSDSAMENKKKAGYF